MRGRLLAPCINWDIIPFRQTGIDLPGPMELPVLIFHALFPLAYRTRKAPYGEHYREHIERDAHGPEHDPGVEIQIRIKVMINEITVLAGCLLQSKGDVHQGVME